MYFNILRVLAVVGLMTTGAAGAEMVGQNTVTDDWFEYEVQWVGRPGDASFVARWTAYPENGVVVVCGAGIYTVGSRVATQKVVRDLDFFIDETPYMRDMSFFAKFNKTFGMISMSKGLVGVDANCASTGKPLPSNIKSGVSLRPGKPNKRY